MEICASERDLLGIDQSSISYVFPIDPGSVEIDYCNEQGYQSRRTITPRSYSRAKDGREFIRAYCDKRRMELTFRVDRIGAVRSLASANHNASVAARERVHAEKARAALQMRQESIPARLLGTDAPITPVAPVNPPRILEVRRKPLSLQAPPIYPPPSSNTPKGEGKSRVRSFIGKAIAALIVMLVWHEFVYERPADSIKRPSIIYRTALTTTSIRVSNSAPDSRVVELSQQLISTLAAKPTTRSPSTQDSVTRRHAHRGMTIEEVVVGAKSTFKIEDRTGSYTRLPEARTAVNAMVFYEKTAIGDQRLISLYLGADRNRNGYLSWDELQTFQTRLDNDYRYIANDLAIKPNEFLTQGGGDCEDWSLVTAGLLRFWGWEAYVGSISPTSGVGHAVCLVRMNAKPSASHSYYHFDGTDRLAGRAIRAGYYVPIDYDHVGRLTRAAKRGWRLRQIYEPESIYGRRM